MKVDPISIVRSSLVFNPAAAHASPRSGSFADILAEAIRAPRSIQSSTERRVATAARADATRDKEAIPPMAESLLYNQAVDLYEQLDTLFREKSVLIAVA